MTDVAEEVKQAEAPVGGAKTTPDQAAFEFYHLVPKIKAQVGAMSLRELKRVMLASAEFPLADSYPKFVSKKETELFIMLLHVEALKNIMKEAVLGMGQEIAEEAVNNVVEETLNKGENNGMD